MNGDIPNNETKCKHVNKWLIYQEGKLRPLKLLSWKWNSISMGVGMRLPLISSRENVTWVVVD